MELAPEGPNILSTSLYLKKSSYINITIVKYFLDFPLQESSYPLLQTRKDLSTNVILDI